MVNVKELPDFGMETVVAGFQPLELEDDVNDALITEVNPLLRRTALFLESTEVCPDQPMWYL